MLRLYHRTHSDAAESILAGGFKDGNGSYLTDRERSGVWFSDRPLDAHEGADGDTLLEVSLNTSDESIAYWEWVEEGKPYREWLMPAALVNSLVLEIRIVDDESAIS